MFQQASEINSDGQGKLWGSISHGELNARGAVDFGALNNVVAREKQLQDQLQNNGKIIEDGRQILVDEIATLEETAIAAAAAAKKAIGLKTALDGYDKINAPKDKNGDPCNTPVCKSETNQKRLTLGNTLVKKLNAIKSRNAKEEAESQK
jgi:hypothetical protein